MENKEGMESEDMTANNSGAGKKNISIAVLTSGGDAQGMNAAIRAIVRKAIHEEIDVYGVLRGYSGLVSLVNGGESSLPQGESLIKKYKARDVGNMLHLGGTKLGSARCQEFQDPETRKAIKKKLESGIKVKDGQKIKIDALIVIGGNGSITGAWEFHEETGFPVIVIPASIDNDINETDYSLGFQTAVNCCTTQITHLRQTASALRRLLVVQVMGAMSGQIALEVGLATGAERIILPECERNNSAHFEKYSFRKNASEIINDLNDSYDGGKKQSIIVVAEGAIDGDIIGGFLTGHVRYEVRVDKIGYIQRGTPPIAGDISLGTRFGVKAVELIQEMFQKNAPKERMVRINKERIEGVSIPEPKDIQRDSIDIRKLELAMELAK